MASQSIRPRLLLPLQGALQGPAWRAIRQPATLSYTLVVARAASSSSGKPIVLEKPIKFNPPSHGSRLRKNTMPKHYGAPPTADEIAIQRRRSYPGMMAPEGTWSHWFWHSRILHVFITMGTLFIMGIFTFFLNYAANSPFKDHLPPLSDLWRQPFTFFLQWKNVMIMHEQERGLRAFEHRTQHQNDVMKRKYYMKMHGIEPKDPITMVFGKGKEESDEELEALALGLEPPPPPAGEEKAPRKKIFGIF